MDSVHRVLSNRFAFVSLHERIEHQAAMLRVAERLVYVSSTAVLMLTDAGDRHT